ncbi:protein kinase domain-containing protein [Actinophytocola oryzae]|uniref:serine/threonine-protein kinase n=1 Tax=Actinophytocola oryzae TaxID=502181 RepID=UPI003C79895D
MTQQPEQVTRQRVIAGRYTLLQEIGRGGMGVVWLADDRTIGRHVAIKELHLPAGVPAEERRVLEERVLREARAAGRLNDPGVVTVYDVVQENGATFIVMELIQAPTLTAIVERQGPLSQDAVARLAGQLLDALDSAHAAGIVHRDVKPSNIMVLANGRVKLTDFGIAQSTDDPRLTTSGTLVGSPTYLAPEVIRGEQADAGSDLWALAASLFYAVEGRAAFDRQTTAATMHAILNEVPYLTRCQGPLASVIMGLLNVTPQARLSTQQVRGLLAQVTQPNTDPRGTAMYTPPPTTLPATAAPVRRGPRWPWVAVAAVLVVGAFAGGWFAGRTGLVEPVVDEAKGSTYSFGGSGADIPAFELYQSQCAPAQLESGRSYTNSADCAGPHDFEVLYVLDPFNSEDDIPYPGLASLKALGEASCALVFGMEDVIPADDRGRLLHSSIVPTEDSWVGPSSDRDRSMYCVISRRDGKQLTEQVLPQN